MNNKKLLGLFSAAFLMPNLAHASDYQHELSAGGSHSEIDIANSDSSDPTTRRISARATLYVAPVSHTGGPLSEAAFLSKSSSVSIEAFDLAYESDNDNPESEVSIDTTTYSLSARYVLPETDDWRSNWVFSGLIEREDVDSEKLRPPPFTSDINEDIEVETAAFSISRYVQKHTEIGLTHKRSDIVLERKGGPALATEEPGEIRQNSLWGRTVRSLNEGTYLSIWGELGQQSVDIDHILNHLQATGGSSAVNESDFDGSYYKVGAAYFPNSLIEIGAQMTGSSHSVLLTSSAGMGDGFSGWIEYFLTEGASIALSYTRHTVDLLDQEFDIDTIAVEGRVRF